MGVEHYGPFRLQSGSVTSHSDRGDTARREQWYEAPSDRFFKEGSILIHNISAVGKNTYCRIKQLRKEEIKLKGQDDIEVPVEVVRAFLVEANAETGAGLSNIGKTAWIEATIEADLVEYKK